MVKIVAQRTPEPIPKGVYKAKIVGSEVRNVKFGDKEHQYIDFIWEIKDGEYAGERVRESMRFYLSPKSKLGEFWKELTGEEVKPDEEYDTDDLIGIEATITVDVETVETADAKIKVNKVKAHIVEDKPKVETKIIGEQKTLGGE